MLYLSFFTSIVSFTVAATVPSTPLDASYSTEYTNARFAAPLDVNMQDPNSVKNEELMELTPYWIDLVNAELVPMNGEGVYIAVLDTGLLANWQYFFSYANIAEEYGMGFTHDIYWDSSLGTFVAGPLHTRSFITDEFGGSGHGIHVVSTIVGYRFGNYWINGVAPK